ncbi:MAG: TetR/AcrR family transcriptional regulator [Solirubrobacteraceae bacterium]|jgi:AcrR family transcriptional regulator
MTARVRPGVFFDSPAALPRGRHELSREQVQGAQRQRLMIAFTELLADRGYANVRINDVAKRAAVSHEAFYDLFANKEDCACTAYDHFIEVLVRRVAAGLSSSESWREFVQAELDGYFGALAADPVVARAFQLEMDAVGATARQRRRKALGRFAEVSTLAQEALRETDPLLKPHSFSVHLASVYGVRQLACDVLDTETEPDFEGLIPDLVDWIVAAWYGGEVPGSP